MHVDWLISLNKIMQTPHGEGLKPFSYFVIIINTATRMGHVRSKAN